MFQHPDAQALYRSVLAAPDDDAPRLILADWLDENGEPERAEYIRLACAIERDKWSDEMQPQRTRLQQLTATLHARLPKQLPNIGHVKWGSWNRGFCHAAHFASVNSLRQRWQRIRTAAPITQATIRDSTRIETLAEEPLIADLRGLALPRLFGVNRDTITKILHSEYLTKLDFLECKYSDWRMPIKSIMTSHACKSLRQLALTHQYSVDDETILGLAKLIGLEQLLFGDNPFTLEDFDRWTNASTNNLRQLRLLSSFHHIYISYLASSRLMSQLKSLTCSLSDERTLHTLLGGTLPPPNLREIIMFVEYDARIRDEYLSIMGGYRGLESLWSLHILNYSNSPELAVRILTSPYAKNLKYFTLHDAPLINADADQILARAVPMNLEYLSLNIRNLTPERQAALQDRFGPIRSHNPANFVSYWPGMLYSAQPYLP